MAQRKPKTKYNPRKIAIREAYDRVLIVCEGRKTEINYFNALIEDLKLNTVNIQVLDIRQTTPDSLFKKAKEFYKRSQKESNPFDRVYCVFDKDGHTKYKDTKNTIKNIKKPKNVYYYAFSEPCFEFWLLLHFKKTDKPFVSFDELSKDTDFRKYFPNYNKSEVIFNDLKSKVPIACKNAKNNLHTNVNELVEYLQNIKSQ